MSNHLILSRSLLYWLIRRFGRHFSNGGKIWPGKKNSWESCLINSRSAFLLRSHPTEFLEGDVCQNVLCLQNSLWFCYLGTLHYSPYSIPPLPIFFLIITIHRGFAWTHHTHLNVMASCETLTFSKWSLSCSPQYISFELGLNCIQCVGSVANEKLRGPLCQKRFIFYFSANHDCLAFWKYPEKLLLLVS